MRDWMRLFRISGLMTVWANGLAIIAYTSPQNVDQLAKAMIRNGSYGLWVLAASTSLYLLGMLTNDLADADRDLRLAPKRPLPSGAVSFAMAWSVAAVLIVLTILCLLQLGDRGVFGGGLVLTLILFYNLATKHAPWLGALNLAAVRMSHAVFVLLAIGIEEFDHAVLSLSSLVGLVSDWNRSITWYPLLLASYIFGVSLISELETRKGRRWELILGGIMMVVPIAWLLVELFTSPLVSLFFVTRNVIFLLACVGLGLCAAALLLWRILGPWITAVRTGTKPMVPPVVIAGLGGIIFFDALAAAQSQPLLSLMILGLWVPFTLLSLTVRMN